MESVPTVFVSYSQKFPELQRFFCRLLADIGLVAAVFDYGATSNPPGEEKKLIESCDGLIGLLTPDEQSADGTLRYSKTVHGEIAMAFYANKVIQLFAFDAVVIESSQFIHINTIARITRHSTKRTARTVLFDEDGVHTVLRTLVEFRKTIDSLYQAKRGNVPAVFAYTLFQARHRIGKNEIQHDVLVKAKALTNVERQVHSSQLYWDAGTSPGLRLPTDPGSLSFTLLKPEDSVATVRLTQNEQTSLRFHIDFVPPLRAGADIEYKYMRRHQNYYPATLEELEQLAQRNGIMNRIMAENMMVGLVMLIVQPTERLLLTIEFPRGYPVKRYKGVVTYGRTETVHREESERLEKVIRWVDDPFEEWFGLQAEIVEPQIQLTYSLLFGPPTVAELRPRDSH